MKSPYPPKTSLPAHIRVYQNPIGCPEENESWGIVKDRQIQHLCPEVILALFVRQNVSTGAKISVKKKETEFLTEQEVEAILRVPDRRTLQGKRDYAILLLLLTTGLRKAEICNLKLRDLKTYRNQAVVDIIGKGKRFRRIPIKNETLLCIQDYLKATKNGINPDYPMFYTLGKHGPYEQRCLTAKAVDCLIKSVAKRALIKKRIHPHVTRHTFGTTLLGKGVDLKTVQSLMGHSHIRTTETYLHTTDDRKVEAIEKLQFG